MSHLLLPTQVSHPRDILAHFDWHLQSRVPLLLISICSKAPASAILLDCDDSCKNIHVLCTGLAGINSTKDVAYSAIGSTRGGASFLASGQMRAEANNDECFNLSFPKWIDVLQSRDSFRCPAPAGHFVRLNTPGSNPKHVVCRVENLSLGGLSVEWDAKAGSPPAPNGITEDAILETFDNTLSLGRLRVAHITPRAWGFVVGLGFAGHPPNEFSRLVLDAQRATCIA
jgi:hypothetical protein